MPAKAATRKAQTIARGQTSHIPTTIKNPERVELRRTELIEVATKMFLERGFHNTSIRDIVRACTFNVASLYMYVSSKEDILYLVAQDLMNNIAQRLSETVLDPSSPERSLEIGFASYCQIVSRFRRPIRLLYREVGFLPSEPRANHRRLRHRPGTAAVGDLDAYINYQLDSIFAGLLVAPEKRTSGSRQRAKVASMRTKTAKKTRPR